MRSVNYQLNTGKNKNLGHEQNVVYKIYYTRRVKHARLY